MRRLRSDQRSIGSGLVLLAAAFVAACSSDAETGHTGPSGAVCPSGSELTYDSFGRDFMSRYCVRCHSSALSGSARNGAPSDHDFDSLDAIHDTPLEHIDEQAAAGEQVNDAMPPSEPKPSDAERRKLGEWLACGAP